MRRLLLASLALLAACQTAPPAPRGEAGQPLLQQAPPVAPPLAADADVDAEHRAKAAGATLEAVDLPVDAAAAAAHPALTAAGLSDADRQRLAGLPLPVLLPDDPDFLARAVVTQGERWYSASAALDGHTLFLTGRARAFRLPEPDAPPPPPDGGLLVTRSEGVVVVAFRAYGVSYTLFLECESPAGDPRCTEDDYALAIAQRLGRVEVAP